MISGLPLMVQSAGFDGGAQELKKGIEVSDRNDYASALCDCRPLAKRGLAKAQFNLGQM
jgi:hypothetical protein